MVNSEEKSLILRKYVAGTVYDLQNLALRQITCTSPKLFNDPIDTYFYYSKDDCFSKYKEILTTEIMDTIRITSFIDYSKMMQERDNTNKLKSNEILMWTHYANAHKGFCFEYHINRKKFAFLEGGKLDNDKHILHKISYMENLATEFETLFSPEQVSNYSPEKYEQLGAGPLSSRCPVYRQALYSSTTTPMERQVPATILIAASTVAAFRSGIFISAIS